MKIADMIRSMHSSGSPIEAIIAAVETVESVLYDREEDRKEKARARTEKWRQSRNVTERHVTSQTPSPQVSLSPYNPLTLPIPPSPSEANASVSETSSDGRPVAKKKRNKNAYSDAFEDFWKVYPTDQNMSKVQAWQAWQRLSPEDHELAMLSVPAFVSYCGKNPDYRPVHANRYLAQRRFEGHAKAGSEISARTSIAPSSPSWNAWRSHYRDSNRNGMVKLMDSQAARSATFTVPSEYPPGFKHEAA